MARRYIAPIPEDLAPAVARLVEVEARRLRRGEYGRPPVELVAWLDQVDEAADEVRRAKLAPHRVLLDDDGPQLIGTAEAAALLGVGPTTLRRGPLRKHATGPKNRLRWPVDVIEAARSNRSHRQSAPECTEKASAGTPSPALASDR